MCLVLKVDSNTCDRPQVSKLLVPYISIEVSMGPTEQEDLNPDPLPVQVHVLKDSIGTVLDPVQMHGLQA